MTHRQTDSLGRATFHHIPAQAHVVPTEREVRWFCHLARHGPQSSQYLYECTRDTHRCKDTGLRQMQKLRASGHLKLPPQQRAVGNAPFRPYVYDLTEKAWAHLKERGHSARTIRPTGHWWHAFLVASATASIDICANRAGITYIPAEDILARRNASLAIPHGSSTTIPDQLFALDYGGRFRAFALEVDRGTEPKTSPENRKSWARTLAQYDAIIGDGVHKSHYGLNAPLLVLWLFTSRKKEKSFLSLLLQRPGSADRSILTQSLVRSEIAAATTLQIDLFQKPWTRARGAPVSIAKG